MKAPHPKLKLRTNFSQKKGPAPPRKAGTDPVDKKEANASRDLTLSTRISVTCRVLRMTIIVNENNSQNYNSREELSGASTQNWSKTPSDSTMLCLRTPAYQVRASTPIYVVERYENRFLQFFPEVEVHHAPYRAFP